MHTETEKLQDSFQTGYRFENISRVFFLSLALFIVFPFLGFKRFSSRFLFAAIKLKCLQPNKVCSFVRMVFVSFIFNAIKLMRWAMNNELFISQCNSDTLIYELKVRWFAENYWRDDSVGNSIYFPNRLQSLFFHLQCTKYLNSFRSLPKITSFEV